MHTIPRPTSAAHYPYTHLKGTLPYTHLWGTLPLHSPLGYVNPYTHLLHNPYTHLWGYVNPYTHLLHNPYTHLWSMSTLTLTYHTTPTLTSGVCQPLHSPTTQPLHSPLGHVSPYTHLLHYPYTHLWDTLLPQLSPSCVCGSPRSSSPWDGSDCEHLTL